MKLYSRENLDFILFDVLSVQTLNTLSFFGEYDKESLGMILDTASELADRIKPEHIAESDRNEPELKKGSVQVHPSVHEFVKHYAEAGFVGATLPEALGGFQIPKTIVAAIDFILCSKSNSFIMYTDLAKGVANVIATFGTEAQKQRFLPNLLSGKWLGTMCLTETESGSSLANITTKAIPQSDGSYHIKGQKIFISAGDHDVTENIMHLVLARIEGAPNGTKGISLFLVPTRLENGEDNDVNSIGIYHKMGQKATPAMHLEFGANDMCVGYLVGEAHKGLSHMFLMMDNARLSVGSMGAGIASAAYYHALRYAKERKQGKHLDESKDASESVAIINHPDVRRMLLSQKAFLEGTLGFILQCYSYLDLQKYSPNEDEVDKYTRLLNLLTPVAKTYGAEHGVSSVNKALQVFGGYGYTADFPLEQLARDVRILPIYEGTTGIHALGLLGRQVLRDQGKALAIWRNEVMKDVNQALEIKEIEVFASSLSLEIDHFFEITQHLAELTKKNTADIYLADANLYMEFFGTLNVGWQWIKQATIACKKMEEKPDTVFLKSKVKTMQFFFAYEIPNLKGLKERLLSSERTTVKTDDDEILM
ncbi:acyl-CoA dehydrogenase [Maribacter sp. PR1]|uniref:Acyl-CoA dehydrogenase n=1 Tax=Maribacter cobaltidurans TaxID=1178778 RepID=A0ABU7IUQ4_9FLAO|nr:MULTISPECIES: acyl-CoA dehydrogenase [Maribacter]MDC6389233.1 acyl-CoA dehydrogenase [Maribacter sp. PR1]MEE1976620.1 acyl-CoA dehydrogenase [Maribacter cobaltidurans]